jgi:hypothetical protein
MESNEDSISDSFSGRFGSVSAIGNSGVGGEADGGRSAAQEHKRDPMGKMSAGENEENEGEGKPGGGGFSFAMPSVPVAKISFFNGGSERRRRSGRRQQGRVKHPQQFFGVDEQEETKMNAEESSTNGEAGVLLTEVSVGRSPYLHVCMIILPVPKGRRQDATNPSSHVITLESRDLRSDSSRVRQYHPSFERFLRWDLNNTLDSRETRGGGRICPDDAPPLLLAPSVCFLHSNSVSFLLIPPHLFSPFSTSTS